MESFDSFDDFYAFVDLMADRLSEEGLAEHGQKLRSLIHEVAWTTGSELLGDLGSELRLLQRVHGAHLPADLSSAIARSMSFISQFWPAL